MHFSEAFTATSYKQTYLTHYNDVIMSATASQITSLAIVYSTVDSVADQRKHQSSASLVFVRGIRRWPVNSPHKPPVTRKKFTFDDVITELQRMRWSWRLKRHNNSVDEFCMNCRLMSIEPGFADWWFCLRFLIDPMVYPILHPL